MAVGWAVAVSVGMGVGLLAGVSEGASVSAGGTAVSVIRGVAVAVAEGATVSAGGMAVGGSRVALGWAVHVADGVTGAGDSVGVYVGVRVGTV